MELRQPDALLYSVASHSSIFRPWDSCFRIHRGETWPEPSFEVYSGGHDHFLSSTVVGGLQSRLRPYDDH